MVIANRWSEPAWRHECNPRCTDGGHCELVWLLPIVEVAGKALMDVLFHVDGWRVRAFEPASEAGPCPWVDHTAPFLVWIEPCPDCGPPRRRPFDRESPPEQPLCEGGRRVGGG